jgi:hypothetical protein
MALLHLNHGLPTLEVSSIRQELNKNVGRSTSSLRIISILYLIQGWVET